MTPTPPTTSPPPSTRTLLLGIWGHLSRRLRIQLVSLGAVLPFLAALIRLVNLWLNGRLAAVGSDLSCESCRRTLYPQRAVARY